MLPVLSLGRLTIPVSPLTFLLAFYVGSELGARALGRLAPPSQQARWQTTFSNVSWLALVAGLVGARLGYAVQPPSLYQQTPQLLLSLRPGALAPLPGLLIASVAALLFLVRNDIDPWTIADAMAIGVAGALIVFNLGRFLTGAAYGLPTDLPWGVELWGIRRHPVQLYEAAALTVVGIFLWLRVARLEPGETFWRFVVLYGVSVLVLDAFHATSPTWLLGIRVPQVIALIALLAGLYVFSFYARRRERIQATMTGQQPLSTQTR